MDTLNRKKISTAINTDIANGVYSNHAKLEGRMQYIANKLFIVNGEQLSRGELQTLKDEGYI